jgi:hypothetical protein
MRRTVAVALIATFAASAQTDEWTQLSQRLQPGDQIQVYPKTQGSKLEGIFVRNSDTEVRLTADNKEIGLERSHIRRIKVKRGSARVRNGLIGAAIGGGATGAIAGGISARYGDGPFPPEIIGGAIALGAGIGLLAGIGAPGFQTVYKAPRR